MIKTNEQSFDSRRLTEDMPVYWYVFLLFFLTCTASALPLKAKDSIDVSLLRFEDYREQVIRKPLLEAIMSDSTIAPGIRSLAHASQLFRDDQYDSAWSLYAEHKMDLPEIEGQILIRMARCALQLGKPDSARAILLSVPSLVKNRPWWDKADRVLAEAIIADTTFTTASKLDSIEFRIQAKPNDDYLAWLKMQKAQLLLAEDQNQLALNIYVDLLHNSEYRGSALEALLDLKNKIGFPRETWPLTETVLRLCKDGHHKECLAWGDSLLVRPDLEKSARQNILAAEAAAWQGLEKLDSARVRYRWLLDSVEMRPGWMQSLVRIERKLKNDSAAERLDTLFRTQFPFSPENANNLWVKAFEMEQESLWVDAFLGYVNLLDPKFGNNQRRQWAPFRMGYIWFKQGMYEEALQSFDKPAQNDDFSWPQAAALYFRAESYHRLGKFIPAREGFLETIRSFPMSWYAHRARTQLLESKLLDSAQIPWIHIMNMDMTQSLDWLRKKLPRNKRDELGTDERVRMVELLFRTGFEDEAQQLLKRSINVYGRRPDFLLEVGMMYSRVGEYGESYRMARMFLEYANRDWFSEIPRPIAEFLYPLPAPWRANAEHYIRPPVDLFFIFAVMRQESIFVPTINSPVGARGLMQFMPKTGKIIAKSEGIKGYNDDLLYNPVMAIRLGNRYLGDLLLEYGGDPVYALSNYNAGPTPTKRWFNANAKLSIEERVEEISYWETREYVKKVMGNYWSYQAIYGR